MDSSSENLCPICMETIRNPSAPVQCCRKVFCDSCLRQAILTRPTCPYCRSPVCGYRPERQHVISLPGLATADPSLQTTRSVGPNLLALINQLRNAQAQALPVASTSNVSLVNQVALHPAAQGTAHPLATPRRRPVPHPRSSAASTLPVTPALNAPAHNTVRTYNCPYCEEGGLADLDLLDHCNANHSDDARRVVCPVCVSLPHGNPQYFSRDFIGHLNLRHCYNIELMTNIYQSDDINIQEALLRSYNQQ